MGEPLLSGAGAASNWVGLKEFYCKVTFGSSAVSTVQTREVVSFARDSAGRYILTLPRLYRTLAEVRFTFQDASGAVLFPVVDEDNVDTTGTVVVELRSETGTATDPDSGSKLTVVPVVSNEPFNDATV